MGRALALIDRIERQIVAHRRRATEAPEMVAAPQEVVPEDVLRDRAECRDSLATFCKRAWHVLEPSQPLRWGWALDAICQHLEAVTAGDIRRLIINVPPGLMKSLGACVFWPSWEWGPKGQPNLKHLAFSYSDKLSTRDNRRCRLLISSVWYRERWGDQFGLTRDQNEKVNFENTKGGWRLAASIGGAGTGLRANKVIVDDPVNVKDGNSAPALIEAQLFTDETLPTRLVEPAESSIVWIMQRVHEQDPVGHILEREHGYTHLMLPMEFEPDRCCVTTLRPATPTAPAITFVDPRTENGELLFPERYPQETVDELRRSMSAYAWAGQMQQRPSPRGGAMIRVDMLEIVDSYPAEARLMRSWDLAGTKVDQLKKNDPDWTRGALCAFHGGVFYILDMRSIRDTPGKVEALIKQTACLDGYKVPVRLPQDPGAAGKSVAEDYVLNVLPGWAVHVDRETGDKVTRAQPFVTAVEHGNVRLVRGDWNKEFLAEATTFPFGRHDDQIDAVTGAHVRLTQAPPPAPSWSVPLVDAVPIEPQTF